MDKKTRIINSILLSIMGICFFPIFIYILIYIYSKLNITMFEGQTIKSNLGDIVLFFGLPIFLVVSGFYNYCLHKYCELTEKEKEKEEEDN